MAGVAWLVGLGVYWNLGFYSRVGLLFISAAILVCALVMLLPPWPASDRWFGRIGIVVVVAMLVDETLLLSRVTPTWTAGVLLAGAAGALQVFDLRRWRLPLVGAGLALFCLAAAAYIRTVVASPPIDVFVFQQMGPAALLKGINPYTSIYPNIYGPQTPFYSPDVLDASGRLTVGFPYPPLSLAMILPAYVLGGDSRYADIAAAAATAWLIAAATRTRTGGLAAFLLLLTPRMFWVIGNAWTETLFAFTFSLVMWCALRWRRGLPYALGLFLATKQYSVFALPLIGLLMAAGDGWRGAARLVGTAVIIAGLITIPFLLWNPAAFWRSIVVFHLLQPRSLDSLSHLVWMRANLAWVPFLSAVPFAAAAAVIGLVLWRAPRSPAYFAGGVTLLHLVFFAFNDRAFANYYYFTMATAAWACAAASRHG